MAWLRSPLTIAAFLWLALAATPVYAVGTADSVNLGVGTATPKSRLDVNGNLAIGASYAATVTAPTNGAIIEGTVGIATSSPTAGTILDLGSATGTSRSSLLLPKDSTTNRPSSPVSGMLRFNTTNNVLEVYNGTTWTTAKAAAGVTTGCGQTASLSSATSTTITVSTGCRVLFKVWGAGGGGGGGDTSCGNVGSAGGGGAYATTLLGPLGSSTTYYLVVGAGGAGGSQSTGGAGGTSISGYAGGVGGAGPNGPGAGGGGGAPSSIWTGSYGGTPVVVAGGGGGGLGAPNCSSARAFANPGGIGLQAASSTGGAGTTGDGSSTGGGGGGGGGYPTGGTGGAANVGGNGGSSYAATGSGVSTGVTSLPGNHADSNRPSNAGNGGAGSSTTGTTGNAGAIYYYTY